MWKTSELVDWLESLDGDTSGLCEVIPTRFDSSEFIRRIAKSPSLQMRASSDGLVSIVRDQADARDKSKQSKSFDLHTDGCYYEIPPELVLLYCEDPGHTDIKTALGDSTTAISMVSDCLPILTDLDFIYMGKDFSGHRRPLIERHPRSGVHITNLATRGYVQPRVSAATLSEVPDLKEIVSALHQFYAAIDTSIILDHSWRPGDYLCSTTFATFTGAAVVPSRTCSGRLPGSGSQPVLEEEPSTFQGWRMSLVDP
ncbi:TauD/TfdA family dioxygenase [Streptomyces violascens]|uniref:TauD/TfdA family dioxygenase n=1 Tax=Streptomyces violascens TaxID=67381 RepID=UPI0036B40E58